MTIFIVIISIQALLLVLLPRLTYVSGKENGMAIASRKPKELEYSCSHIWSPWEFFEQQISDKETGENLYKQSAQRRKCEFCGYQQYEKLSVWK